MYKLRLFYRYCTTLLLAGALLLTAQAKHPKKAGSHHANGQVANTKVIQELASLPLQETLHAIAHRQPLRLKKCDATFLLLEALKEKAHVKVMLAMLLGYYKQQRITFNRHSVMCKAIKESPCGVEILAFLLENQVYKKAFLSGSPRYKLLTQLPLIRQLHFLLACWQLSFLPSWLLRPYNYYSTTMLIIQLIHWLLGLPQPKLLVRLRRWEAAITGGLSVAVVYYLLRIAYLTYRLHRLSFAKDYLFQLLESERPPAEIEEMALLLLKHGANPQSQAFFLEPKALPDPLLGSLLKPYYYYHITALHQAAKLNLYSLCRQLIKEGCDPSCHAFIASDRYDPDSILSPIRYVPFEDLYNRPGNKTYIIEEPLDWAPPQSKVALFLNEAKRRKEQPTKK